MKKLTQEEWISKASIVHSNLYDYSEVVYKTSRDKVMIICKKHGKFEQKATNHMQGQNCPDCSNEIKSIKTRSTKEEFILKANEIHKNIYDYSLVKYINTRNKICILCKIHGEFWQTPTHHLRGEGCPICSYSKGELLIHNWLKENNIPFRPQFELITEEVARNTNLMKIDFFVKYNNKQYFIEYDGIQHFEYIPFFHREDDDFFKQQRRDKVLNEFCELHKDKVTLIRFKYDDNNIIDSLINIFKIT